MIASIGWNVVSLDRIVRRGEGEMRQKHCFQGIMLVLVLLLSTACTRRPEPACPTIEVWVEPSPTFGPTITPYPTVVEPGLAYGIPCRPPCWRTLTPGQSTRAEAFQVREQLRTDEWVNYISGTDANDAFIVGPTPSSRGSIFVIIEQDVVSHIQGSLLFDYTVGEMLEQFGPPEDLYLFSRATVCSACEVWETTSQRFEPALGDALEDILYPEQGLWFKVRVPSSGRGCICPDMRIEHFCYHAPLSLEEALTDHQLVDVCWPGRGRYADLSLETVLEWHGFGGGY